MKNIIFKKNGFTLVELMIASSLAIIILGISLSSFIALKKVAEIASTYSALNSAVRNSMDTISRDIRAASEVTYYSESSIIIVVNRDTGPEKNTYYLQDGAIFREGAAKSMLATNISELTFVMYENDGITTTETLADAFAIDVKIIASSTVAGTPYEDGLQTRVAMRNRW